MNRSSPRPGIERLREAEIWMHDNAERIGTLRVKDVAGSMGVCYKTLLNAMSDHGTSFATLKRDVVIARSRNILKENPRASLADAGKLMGFKTKSAIEGYFYTIGYQWSKLVPAA